MIKVNRTVTYDNGIVLNLGNFISEIFSIFRIFQIVSIIKIFSILSIFLIFQSCNQEVEHEHNSDSVQKEVLYYCPMDTQVIQKGPGTCSICGMDLEPKPMAHAHDSVGSKEWVYTPVNVSVLSTIKSVKPIAKSLPVKIKVAGYIAYDESRIYSISAKVGGRIENLYVKYNFQPIAKGQALFEIFSHDLQTAQQEYQFIQKNDPGNMDIMKAAKRKLLLLGMTEEQINKLSSGGHAHATTSVYSPYSGYVMERTKPSESIASGNAMDKGSGMEVAQTMNENKKEIELREGAYVAKGESVFSVANTEIVWGIFEVYSSQLTQIQKNQPIHIVLEGTGEMIMGKIDFIEPSYKEGGGTTKVRVHLNNKKRNLKIGNLLSGEIDAGKKKGVWVPQSAVYDLGKDKIVFVKKNGALETRKVSIGSYVGSEVEIINGLTEVEEIAENAQFMVDSESFVKVIK